MTDNPNLVWTTTVVEELAASGLQAVCVAPGSRSTPLTLAFERHPDVKLFLHLDERSAGFFALGMAQASGRPVALVCTSGTAAAEFFPAVIEARQSGVPLLVLTSDRPPELRHSGANQTIDQVKLYGEQVLWFVDVALPEHDPEPVAIRNLRTLAARAYAAADGIVKGPVHLNFPFRKPLEPATLDEIVPARRTSPTVYMDRGRLEATPTQIAQIADLVRSQPRGLIVCGPGCPRGEFAGAVAQLAAVSGYPVLADPLSGVRYGPHVQQATVIGTVESILNTPALDWAAPDLVLRFGAVPTSKWLNELLVGTQPAHQIHVRANGIWADDSHLVTQFLQADETAFCRSLAGQLTPRDDANWLARWAAAEAEATEIATATMAEQEFDAAYVAALVDTLPADTNLFVGNSLPIRHVDQFGRSRPVPLHVYANRGASGIDGTTSTALGIASAERERPLVFLTGDVAFYHDLNGLLALRQHDLRNVTIVLLNNDGGGIFRRLPVAQLEPAFTPLFVTPHGLDFAHAAALYGLDYAQVASVADFKARLQTAITGTTSTLLEIRTDSAVDLRHQRSLVSRIRIALAQSIDQPA